MNNLSSGGRFSNRDLRRGRNLGHDTNQAQLLVLVDKLKFADGTSLTTAPASGAIDASTIASGTVTNAEFEWLSDVPSGEAFTDTLNPYFLKINWLYDTLYKTGLSCQKFHGFYNNTDPLNSGAGKAFFRDAGNKGMRFTTTQCFESSSANEGNTYSYRWWGNFTPPAGGTNNYYFRTTSDDYSHVYINSQMVVDGSSGGLDTTTSSAVSLVYFGENSGGDEMIMEWKGPSPYDSWTSDLGSVCTTTQAAPR